MGIQKAKEQHSSSFLDYLENKLHTELDLTLLQEETFWNKKSCDKWLTLRDKNNSCFHTNDKVKMGRRRILSLKDSDGTIITEPSLLKSLAVNFFNYLYTKYGYFQPFNSHCIFPDFLRMMISLLFAFLLFRKLRRLFFSMNGQKPLDLMALLHYFFRTSGLLWLILLLISLKGFSLVQFPYLVLMVL